MEITLYTTHCPKCNVLTKKLQNKGISFNEVTDVDVMLSKGFTAAPVLEVDGVAMNFGEANKFVNDWE